MPLQRRFTISKNAVTPFANAVHEQIERYKKKSNSQQNSLGSNADEIIKLKQLFDSGALTQEEFEDEKRKVLSR